MKLSLAKAFVTLLCTFSFAQAVVFADEIRDHPITFTENGALASELEFPVYEWQPSDAEPTEMILAIHGLTLHGRSYSLLGKAFAAGGFYFVSSDMRGFGLCQPHFSAKHEWCKNYDCKWKVDYAKSYTDIVCLAQKMRKKYPGLKLTVIGESLGSTLALQIAAEHPELVDRVILSAPAVKLNHAMFTNSQNVKSGLYAALISPRFQMNLQGFISKLVSNNPKICKEMLDDPLVRKKMPLSDLLQTESCVGRSIKYAQKMSPNIPLLIVQGSQDHCVIPEAIVQLSEHTRSTDQTIRWLNQTGHLLLETHYVRPGTVAALIDWFDDHTPEHLEEVRQVEQSIRALGGKVE